MFQEFRLIWELQKPFSREKDKDESYKKNISLSMREKKQIE